MASRSFMHPRWGALVAVMFLAACTETNGAAGSPATSELDTSVIEVCPQGCDYDQLGPAVDASKDGDTIDLAAGTYRGGVSVDTSVTIVGAGATSTIVRGGGPVMTIGTEGAAAQPTVTIEGVTITGGLTRSPDDRVEARGGGVEIPWSAGETLGATVVIRQSVITGNRAIPSKITGTDTSACGHGGDCPYTQGAGGGIDNWGTLTLEGTTVSDNVAGTAPGLRNLASDAQGGGIMSWLGPLTIVDSVIDYNVARASAPYGRFAEGGGIMLADRGSFTIRDSTIANNVARLDAAFPASVDMAAQPGGIFIADGVSEARISGTRITGNAAVMTNSVGNATAWAGGINVGWEVDLEVRGSDISNNHVRASTTEGSRGSAEATDGGGELWGTIVGTDFHGNTVSANSTGGDALAADGAIMFTGRLVDCTVTDNRLRASSPEGTVSVFAAGVLVADRPVSLVRTTVDGNTAEAIGRRGFVRGGGIYDAPSPLGAGSVLTLRHARVTGNVIEGSPGLAVQGGGIYLLDHPFLSFASRIAGNRPDEVSGQGHR